MTQNTWYTVARTPDSECTGRVFFSIGESSLSFDVFIQYGNISISIVSAVVEADTVFSMRVRSFAGFCYVDVKSNREYSSSPSVSVSQTLGTLVVMPFLEAGDGKQECIVTTDAWAPAPVSETYVTIDRIEAITALKYFEDGIAIGNRDAYWALVYGNDGVYVGGKRIITAQDVLGYATQNWVLAKGYITSAALTGYVNGGAYNSTTKNIELKHDSTVIAQIDATAFIKDGMVDTVVVENGYLIITFNTDSGKEPISIALTDIFDADNYYTKDEADAKFLTEHQSLTGYATQSWVTSQGYLTSYTETDPTVPSWAKQSSKPSYSYSEITGTPAIPESTSDLTNDSGFITASDIPSSYAWSAITSTPTTLSGYGITDAKISNGVITLGSNTITPLTSFTETDPTVPSWAKASSKPSYTFSEIGTTPTTISGYGITDAKIENGVITLGSNTITPLTSFTETDPTVPSWAKASTKPTYTASEVGALPASTSIPSKTSDLTNDSGFITSSAIPTNVSSFNNDVGYITSYTETDPTVPSWAKQSSKPSYSYSEISNTPTNVSAFTNDAGYLTQHQSLDGLTPKVQAIPYIVGPDTDTTAGTWTGTYAGITELTEGLTIVYVPHVAGATTTTLNINGLGAKTCYWTGTSKLTTHYPVGTPILLTYHNNGWRRADSNTTYSAGTKALFDAGTNTSNRVWSASVLASAVAPIVHEHDWSDINNAPAFITADALNGYATESWVSQNFNFYTLPAASANVLGGVKVGTGLAIDANGVLSVSGGGVAVDWTDISNTPSTLSGYGITDAKIANGTITLGSNTITPITSHQSLSGYATETWVGQQGFLTSYTETDPTVPSWAKASTKPSYSYSEISNTPSIPSKTSDLTNDSGFITSAALPTKVSDLTNDSGFITSYTETDPTVPSWAKASSKPSYTLDEVTDGTSRKIPTKVSQLTNDSGFITGYTETDPTVPSWAKASSKPSYTFSEIGSKPTTLSGYGITDAKIASGTITLGGNTITPLTSHQSLSGYATEAWVGQQGYLTSFTETDPVFAASAAYGISSSDISTWNGKYAKPSAGIPKTDLANAVQTSLGLADTALQSVPLATDSTIGGFKTGNVNQTYLYFDNDILKVSDSAIADYLLGEGYFDLPTWQDIQNTPTTLSGYGITDAKIANGTITLGSNSITPLTSFTETDPTVPNWAKQSSKPTYTASEVGALPNTTVIPTKTSDLTNDSGFITGYTETDPVFSASDAAGITAVDVSNWDEAYGWGNHASAGYALASAIPTSINDLELILDGSTEAKYIYGHGSSGDDYVVFGISNLGNIVIGSSDFQADGYKSYIYAYEHNLYWGTGTNKRLYFTAAGVIRPTTNNNISLGTSSYKYKELYATDIYGNLDWSYIDNTPTTLSGYGITDAQKAITVSSSEPTSSQGSDGDIWIVI